jgi:hypothetical protein
MLYVSKIKLDKTIGTRIADSDYKALKQMEDKTGLDSSILVRIALKKLLTEFDKNGYIKVEMPPKYRKEEGK